MKLVTTYSFFYLLMMCVQAQTFKPRPENKKEWMDTDGHFINAHGAGILYKDGTYYLFGEIKKGITWLVPGQDWEDYRVPAGGISCYSSKDLKKWKFEGVALKPTTGDPQNDIDTGRVIERPKVIYNDKTKKYVMWMHIDKNDYSYSQLGVAVSDKAAGPYEYLGSITPNGQTGRDMTVFKDDDGKAYLIYASEKNATMQVCLIGEDYITPTTSYSRILENRNREAPAVFKHEGKYYLITSGCTGWSPNAATYAVADDLLGPWEEQGNPCTGKDADSTFYSQGAFVLPLKGKPGEFIFMADKWNKSNLPDSRYIWLPLTVSGGKVIIKK